MTRHDMIERIGNTYMTSNIEGGEYSYIQEAGSRANLENALGRSISHFKLDIRFEKDDIVVLVETKQSTEIFSVSCAFFSSINHLFINDFCCSVANVIHLLYPQHHIFGFEFFCNLLLFGE